MVWDMSLRTLLSGISASSSLKHMSKSRNVFCQLKIKRSTWLVYPLLCLIQQLTFSYKWAKEHEDWEADKQWANFGFTDEMSIELAGNHGLNLV